ncbi:DUF551 domain-containing protein [Escherichia coli]|nr:DUF551 domain-containing protein [Escherichia coli]
MTTITRKEQKQVLIDTANHVINRDNTSPYSENLRELARIALASLEAKPIGAFHIAEQQVDGTSDYIKDGEWPIDNGTIEVYAVPPVPVVPEEKPMPNPLKMYAVDAVAAIAEVRGWNACRAAMLQGAEPVSQTYKLPPLSSSEVNDAAWKLHNMLTEHVPLNGRQFNNLKGCFYEALKVAMRNYPVTPDGWISCSERMPAQDDWILIYSKHGEYMAGQVQEEYVELSDGTLSWLGNALFWMPLPEPPQEAK